MTELALDIAASDATLWIIVAPLDRLARNARRGVTGGH